MPSGYVGIPIDPEMIGTLMQDLCIKPERMKELIDTMNDTQRTGNPADELQRYIAKSTKANEVAFLSFMCGFCIGTVKIVEQVRHELPAVLTAATMVGAENPDEIKQMVAKLTGDSTSPQATAAKKKPDQTENEDPMYR